MTEPKTGLVSRIADPRLTESSGLALSKRNSNLIWTMPDEARSPQVFGIQLSTGKTVRTVDLKNAGTFTDSESIRLNALGQLCLADIGDNEGNRKNCGIGVFDDPGASGDKHIVITAIRYPISYEDGPRNAESLLINPITNEHFIISKESKGRLYAFGSNLSKTKNVGKYVKTPDALPAYATDATFSPDAKFVYIRAKGTSSIFIYDAVTWKKRATLSAPSVQKGESITVEPEGKSVIIGSEGANSPLYRVVLPQLFWPKADGPASTPTTPSKVLNLTNWKLTLPLPLGSHTSATEIKQPQLADFRDSRFFHVNATGTAVIFNAPCNGATTSNSGYPRSELREMHGSSLASWSTASGVHKMTIRQAITHLPDVKKHVVAGQIHDADDDVLMVRLEDKKLFIECRGVEKAVLTDDYVLGTVFTILITAQKSGIYIRYNNGSAVKILTGVYSGCYFKAGCYTQSNLDRGDTADAYGEVAIYGLTVTHE